jgi:hypothetical protein
MSEPDALIIGVIDALEWRAIEETNAEAGGYLRGV